MATDDLLLVPTRSSDPAQPQASLHALDLACGDPRWRQPYPYAMISGLAATTADLILVALTSTHRLEGQGALVALGVDGAERWRWAPDMQRVSAPALTRNAVCVAADAQTLVVLDLAGDREQARIELDATVSLSAPAVEEGVAYVPCRGSHLLAMGLDGKPRWHFEATDNPEAWLEKTPVVTKDSVFAVRSDGIVLALRVSDGHLLWQTPVGPAGKPLSPPATDGERLYAGARDGVHALDLEGQEVWHFPTGRRIEAVPVEAGGVVYTACRDHRLYALDSVTGRELWRYEVERRIEVPPVLAFCGGPPTPCVLVADRGGTLTAIALPLTAEELAAAGCWLEAADAYARLGRPLRRAEALERHARSLAGTTCDAQEQAAAWEAAAGAFEAEGEAECAAVCRGEAARCLQQPVITLDVRLDRGLVLNRWSQLRFVVRNEGYGSARNLTIRASGEQFEGQVTHTQRITTLRTGQEREETLDVRPIQCGDTVPLRVRLEYQDRAGEPHACDHTIHIAVASEDAGRGEGRTINVFVSGGGAAAVGDRAVATGAGGVAVGGDVYGAVSVSSPPAGSAPASPSLPGTTHVLSFDRLSPLDFERLCLWLVEREGYTRAEHLGLAGSEQGRDVIARKPTPGGEELWYFQCKRYTSIGAKTLKDEVDKYLALVKEKPELYPAGVVFVVSCAVSAKTREDVGAYCEQHGLRYECWALTELDMRTKRHPDLLREFFNWSI